MHNQAIDGALADEELQELKDSQRNIYEHFKLACGGPASRTIQSIDPDVDDLGNVAFARLREKYGSANT